MSGKYYLFYNSKHRHGSSEQMPPAEYENLYYQRLRSVWIIRGDSYCASSRLTPTVTVYERLTGNGSILNGGDCMVATVPNKLTAAEYQQLCVYQVQCTGLAGMNRPKCTSFRSVKALTLVWKSLM